MHIFIDTTSLIALYNPKDQYHKIAKVIAQNLYQPGIFLSTTEYIIDEVYTGLLPTPRGGYRLAMVFDHDIDNGLWNIISIDEMNALDIKHVFAFDTHFSQMGFLPLKV